MKTYQKPIVSKQNNFGPVNKNIWLLREQSRKAEWIKNKEKELKGFEEDPKEKIHLDSKGNNLENARR